MLVVKVWCLPEMKEMELKGLHREIVDAVTTIPEVKIDFEAEMECLFPCDMMKRSTESAIIVEVTGLYEGHARTENSRYCLANNLIDAVQKYCTSAKGIDCHLYVFRSLFGGIRSIYRVSR